MGEFLLRVVVVDDYEPWRTFFSTTLQKQPGLRIIEQASDGLEAVGKVAELQPDLILLDIGLPTLNGIEAARLIRNVSPSSKILFVSENRSPEIVQEALRTGASGYLLKSNAGRELLSAVKAVLGGRRFVSASLAVGITRHEVGFYFDDRLLLDDLTLFVGSALDARSAAIVAACESHRHHLLPRLQTYGLDMAKAIWDGRYIAVDAADGLAQFMLNGVPDPTLFMTLFDNLIQRAAKASMSKHSRVVIFGECVRLLWAPR